MTGTWKAARLSGNVLMIAVHGEVCYIMKGQNAPVLLTKLSGMESTEGGS